MISMARIFGAPVMLPQGNSARTISGIVVRDLSCAVTVETIVCKVG